MTDGRAKATVLVVEDEGIIARDLQATLRVLGYTVPEPCASGPEAIAAAREHRPDLILMDIHIKGDMDGIDTAKAIQAERPTAVVFLTAFADAETLDRARLTIPYGYLVKPYEEATLATTIAVTLQKAKADAQHRASHDLLQGLLAGVPQPVLAADANGDIVYANASADATLKAVDTGQLVGQSLEAVLRQTASPGALELLTVLSSRDPTAAAGGAWHGVPGSIAPLPPPLQGHVIVLGRSGDAPDAARRVVESISSRAGRLV